MVTWTFFKLMTQAFLRRNLSAVAAEASQINSSHYYGSPRLKRDDEGSFSCVSCGLCVEACPTTSLELRPYSPPPQFDQYGPQPEQMNLHALRCVQCGLCERICPFEAIGLVRFKPVLFTQSAGFDPKVSLTDLPDF